MRKNKKFNLRKITVVNFNVSNKLFGGEKTDSCGDEKCVTDITQTNTDTKHIDICGSDLVCTTSD